MKPDDTAATLYDRLEESSRAMFEESWPTIRTIAPHPQLGEGTYHRMRDLAALDLTTESDLAALDKLRARTFPPHGAEFERGGRRWRATVTIVPAD